MKSVLRAVAVALLALAATFPGAGAAAATDSGYRLDLARRGDFVAHTIPTMRRARMGMMLGTMVALLDDDHARTQFRLQTLARALSPSRPDGRSRLGASVVGWSAGLNELGAGPYELIGTTTIDEALRLAAIAIRDTGKPVGLLMWQGRHAWVMSGFRATADPSTNADFRVTGVSVFDPLYPRGSRRWGASPKPGQLLSVAELGRQFVPRRSGPQATQWLAGFAGMYVIVAPYRVSARPAQRAWHVTPI